MRTELELKLEEIIVETDELITLQSRVAKELEATREPLRVTNLCLEERSDWELMDGEQTNGNFSSFLLLSNSSIVMLILVSLCSTE